MSDSLQNLTRTAKELLEESILPFWTTRMPDLVNGGFYGRITGEDVTEPEADKGAILNARILWFFSAVCRVTGDRRSREQAERAFRYLLKHFYDNQYGGVYWSIDCKGAPCDTKKQIYALGFAIYGLSEYYRATGEREALEYAIRLFHSIEGFSHDARKGGYLEAVTREGAPIADMRLSAKDANERKTMNTHLHILEPYTNLYRVWNNETLRLRLQELIELFLDKILDSKSAHLGLFFDDDWKSKSAVVSYGHDIEASWLIHEAAMGLGDPDLFARVERAVPRIATAAAEGLQPDGSLIYEYDPETGHTDRDRHWWVQAEAVVGYLNLYQHFGDRDALQKATETLRYIREKLVDPVGGEWFWSIRADGSVNRTDDKAGFWKCPYHNGRMCLEILERFR